MIDMWNLLLDCYTERCLTLQDMQQALEDPDYAFDLWKEFCDDRETFVPIVQDEVRKFKLYIEKKDFVICRRMNPEDKHLLNDG